MKNPYEVIIYNVSKEEVETKNLKGIKDLMKVVTKLGKNAKQRVVIAFDGFDDMTEELYELPEVRAYIAKILHEFPFLFYYLNREFETHQTFVFCVSDVEAYKTGQLLPSRKYYENGNTPPQFMVIAVLSPDLFQKFKKATVTHGNKIKDIVGAKETVEMLGYFVEVEVFEIEDNE